MSKKPKLGTYTGLKQRLLDVSDPNRRFITVKNPSNFPFTYVDLFCGAGGLTKGFFDAKFLPISSVEISDIASETHEFNFPDCNHFCGDIVEFDMPIVGKEHGKGDSDIYYSGRYLISKLRHISEVNNVLKLV